MVVTIENPENFLISHHELRVLKTMFNDYHRLVVKSRFSVGLGGPVVFLVRPVLGHGSELPSVVKIDLYERIQQEWMAYRVCIRNQLPNAAEILGEPVNPIGSQYSGLCYPLAGAGIYEIVSLHQYFLKTSPEKIDRFLKKRFFKTFARLWRQSEIHPDFSFRAAYDDFLPLNLIVEYVEHRESANWLHPDTTNEREWQEGEFVQVSGFKVVELLREKQGLLLDTPHPHNAFRFRVYGFEDVSKYEVGQIIQRPFSGQIKATRQSQLLRQVQSVVGPRFDLQSAYLPLPDGKKLPNPLVDWQRILGRTMDLKVACIHGHLTMENVLVELDTETVHIIDFSNSRRNHVLRDLLHLEMSLVVKLLPATMTMEHTANSTITTIHELYRRLHCEIVQGVKLGPPNDQEKVFTILRAIRQAAQPFLFEMDNWREYYYGLFIYLLGSLRFSDLDRLYVDFQPKLLAFWGAATVLDLINNEPDCSEFTVNHTTPKWHAINDPISKTVEQRPISKLDKIVSDWQENPLSQRLILFNILIRQFSMNELEELAFKMGLDLDDLPSSGKSSKAQELIGYFERRGRIRKLIEATAAARPEIQWE